MGVTISSDIYNDYLNANVDHWGKSVRYDKIRYALPHPVFKNPNNYPDRTVNTIIVDMWGYQMTENQTVLGDFKFPALKGENKGKITLKAVATAGLSVFWAPNK